MYFVMVYLWFAILGELQAYIGVYNVAVDLRWNQLHPGKGSVLVFQCCLFVCLFLSVWSLQWMIAPLSQVYIWQIHPPLFMSWLNTFMWKNIVFPPSQDHLSVYHHCSSCWHQNSEVMGVAPLYHSTVMPFTSKFCCHQNLKINSDWSGPVCDPKSDWIQYRISIWLGGYLICAGGPWIFNYNPWQIRIDVSGYIHI